MKVVIIGAGISALAASIRLRHEGHEVEVFEAKSGPGGKVHTFHLGPYRFDGGPSLFTMPHYVTELFDLLGADTEHYFAYDACEEACRYFWEDGVRLTAFSEPERFAQEAQRVLGFPSEELLQHFEHLREIYQRSASIFLEKPLHRWDTWWSKDVLRSLFRLRSFDLNKSMHRANVIRLGEPHLVQLFDRFATYNGSDPYQAPGILNVIPWLEHGFGTYFPKGGMIEIPHSLHRLALDHGVKFRFSTPVERIVHSNGKVQGVEVNGSLVASDAVVCNMDIHFAYERLLQGISPPKRLLKQERSSSALVFYWGIRGTFDELGLHNIFFSADYKKEFEALFRDQHIHEDPTIYVHVSSKMEKSDAPKDCENWFVMVNAPHHAGQDWNEVVQTTRKRVLTKLNRLLDADIEPMIEEERTWDPKGIEADTLSYRGSLYGNSSNSAFAAFLRHPNDSSQLKGLYFSGGSVHPGGGIPLALLSARITTELMKR